MTNGGTQFHAFVFINRSLGNLETEISNTMYDEAYKKELAYERIQKVWETMVSCIEDWPKARLGSSKLEQLQRPFKELLSCPYESLTFIESRSGGVYYLGQTRGGVPHGIGMNFTNEGDYHYCKMFIGHWMNGERGGGEGVYFNFCGDEMDWFIQHQTHSSYGGKKVNYQIDWRGIASGR